MLFKKASQDLLYDLYFKIFSKLQEPLNGCNQFEIFKNSENL